MMATGWQNIRVKTLVECNHFIEESLTALFFSFTVTHSQSLLYVVLLSYHFLEGYFMVKIFISHATTDGDLATELMDLLQNQFNLTRDDFFHTSDSQLEYGGNWIEQIRKGMEDASIILPIITPNYLESEFCLCELGASWVNQQSLVPVIIPPLDHNALQNTPYRSWLQSITLNSKADLSELASAMTEKGIGHPNIARFNKRAEKFYIDHLTPFIQKMNEREILTPAAIKAIVEEKESLEEAFNLAEADLLKLEKENSELRNMKDTEQIKAFDRAQMSEWGTFIQSVEDARKQLKSLPNFVVSVLYHDHKKNKYRGFYGDSDDLQNARKFESQGFVVWDDGWVPDFDHPAVERALQVIKDLASNINNLGDVIEERFNEEYHDIRLSLEYSPFWEEVLNQTIQHSTS